MLTKNRLKYYSSLLDKKERRQEKKFLAEGKKLIFEAVNWGYECDSVFTTEVFAEENADFLEFIEFKGLEIEILKSAELSKLCDTKTPQGIVGVFNFKGEKSPDLLNEKLIVALENISDPGNMGTILRNCDWFGIKNVLISPDCAEIYNPKVIRASAGSLFHLNLVEEENIIDSLITLKESGFKLICADLNGTSLYEFGREEKEIIILANEANGPTRELLEICDSKITIPKLGEAESLNVASASAVILSELTRPTPK